MRHGTCQMSRGIPSKNIRLLISPVLSSLIWMEYQIDQQVCHICCRLRKLLLLVALLLELRTRTEWLFMMQRVSLVQLVCGGEMFRVFGHDKVWVLDGGLPRWRASGYDVESSASGDAILKASAASEAIEKIYQGHTVSPITFQTKFQPHLVWTLDQVKNNLEDQTYQHVDARSKARFDGTAPEPRKGIRSGHIPGSKCVPYPQLFDSASQTMLPAEDLKKRFEQEEISLDKPIMASCGTGVTACILAMGLHRVGKTDVPVYDGSWTEWATQPDLPMEGEDSSS
ncbi:thiosulfate/3-mercaptopyruvate sulfurtransferase 1, mitochondrial isoform X2 [Raphanus sativus]|uniref:Sulfurtransferase n=1 Tax=Raphanus sativus TaxID=3726 RepID=A0A6J0K425_RAPSA|nr:thiosulfate/3-mercaptopyruvate sulfurtransferase 1, mitochondrial isoform X2 [Raphanus sativus]